MNAKLKQERKRQRRQPLRAARGSTAVFRIEQLTRALHIAAAAIKGNGPSEMSAKSIARHALRTHGAKGDIWSLPAND